MAQTTAAHTSLPILPDNILTQEAFEKCWAHSLLRAVLHCHSPGVATAATVALTEGTAMAPWNGPNQEAMMADNFKQTMQNADS